MVSLILPKTNKTHNPEHIFSKEKKLRIESFVRLLEELRAPYIIFEISWPLNGKLYHIESELKVKYLEGTGLSFYFAT